MELSRLLRRVLLVAAVAVAGWLLSVLVAGTASAEGLPDDGSMVHSGQSGGLLGSLLGGVTGMLGGTTGTVSAITDSLSATPDAALSPSVTTPDPVAPETPPTEAGAASTDRVEAPRAEVIFTPAVPRSSAAAPAAPATATVPVVTVPVVRVVAPPAPTTSVDQGLHAEEHAGQGTGHQRQPGKAPAAPAGTGTATSTTHDSFGGVRGAHGVLPAQTVLHPAGAGYTTRSRAVDAAGRAAGLPASSPD